MAPEKKAKLTLSDKVFKPRAKRAAKPNPRYKFMDEQTVVLKTASDVKSIDAANKLERKAVVKETPNTDNVKSVDVVKTAEKTGKDNQKAMVKASMTANLKSVNAVKAVMKSSNVMEQKSKGRRCSKQELRAKARANKKVNILYRIEFAEIAGDEGFDVNELMVYLRTELKVANLKVELQGGTVDVSSETFFKKKYLKFVAVNFLKKKTKLKNFVHIIADTTDSKSYKFEYYTMET